MRADVSTVEPLRIAGITLKRLVVSLRKRPCREKKKSKLKSFLAALDRIPIGISSNLHRGNLASTECVWIQPKRIIVIIDYHLLYYLPHHP